MNNQLHFHFVFRSVRLLVSLIRGGFLALILLLLLSRPVSQAQAEYLSSLSNGSGWRQSNTSGFGNSTNSAFHALEAFNGQLYAGATNYNQGATIWRTTNGISWAVTTSPGFINTYTNSNVVLFDLIEFNGQLYAGTGDWWEHGQGVGGQIWRSPDGTNWIPVEENGFGDINNTAVTTFGVFSNTLYAATGGNVNGVQIWRSNTGDVGSWTRVITDGDGNANNRWVTGFSEFDGYLYASIEPTTGTAKIWRTNNGTTWAQVNASGFGDTNNIGIGRSAIFNGYLCAGTRNSITGAQLWRSNNGTNWNQVVGNGFGDINNNKIESLMTFDGALYAMTNNQVTGGEVWRSTDGTTWVQDAPDGFGSGSTNVEWTQTTTIFNNSLFIGTVNNTLGGQVWQRLHQVYLPMIIR